MSIITVLVYADQVPGMKSPVWVAALVDEHLAAQAITVDGAIACLGDLFDARDEIIARWSDPSEAHGVIVDLPAAPPGVAAAWEDGILYGTHNCGRSRSAHVRIAQASRDLLHARNT